MYIHATESKYQILYFLNFKDVMSIIYTVCFIKNPYSINNIMQLSLRKMINKLLFAKETKLIIVFKTDNRISGRHLTSPVVI